MNRVHDALHCLSVTFFAALIGLAGWGLIYYSTASFRQSRHLSLPKDKTLVATFSLQIVYDEKAVTVGGQLRCHPRPLKSGIDYRCLFDNFAMRDAAGTLLLAFEKNPDQNTRYTVDPKLPPERRKALFEAFHIDTTSHDYSADRSLFQQPFSLFVSPRGKIKEVGLAPALRNALHAFLAGSPAEPIVKTWLTAPNRLPPLFTQRGHKKRWTTQGFFFSPMTFHHRAQIQDNRMTITTRSSVKEGTPLTVNDWQLQCVLENQMLRQMRLDLSFGTDRDFFNHHISHRYHMSGDVAFTYHTPSPHE